MKYIVNFLLSVLTVVFCQAQDIVGELSYPQINFHANLPIKEDRTKSSYNNYIDVQRPMLMSSILGLPVTDLHRWNALKLMYDYENTCMIKCEMLDQDSIRSYAENFDFNSELADAYEKNGSLYFHEPITRFDLGFVNKYVYGLTLPHNLDTIEFIPSQNTECDALNHIQCFNNDNYIYWLSDTNSTLLIYACDFFRDKNIVEVPYGITHIADGAMRQSIIPTIQANRTLILPNTIKSIGHKSLENCGFSKIIILGEDELDIPSDVFGDNPPTNTVVYANNKIQKVLKKSLPQFKKNVKKLDKKILNELSQIQ